METPVSEQPAKARQEPLRAWSRKIPRTANAYRQTMGIPAESKKRVKMGQTSGHHTPYISEIIQTHGFENDLVTRQFRERSPRRAFTRK